MEVSRLSNIARGGTYLPFQLLRRPRPQLRRRAPALLPSRTSTIASPFSTSSRLPATTTTHITNSTGNDVPDDFTAAPEIDFDAETNTTNDQSTINMGQLRVVPASPSYFSSTPNFTDRLLELESLMRKHELLPRVDPGAAPRVAWKDTRELRVELGEHRIKSKPFARVKKLLHKMNCIHPSLMPGEVASVLEKYKRDLNPHVIVRRQHLVDEYGRALGLGRRKTSKAAAWLVEGDGQVLVNGKSLADVFGRVHDRESAIWALKATQRIGRYNVWALVNGGGVTGQAEALTLAVAKSLLVHEPALKPALRKAGCVTRDPRNVERKKPGFLKARKRPTWVKR